MVKKLCALLLILMLPLIALAAEQRVFDNSGLFSAEEEDALEEQIAQLREAFNVDFVILTDDRVPYSADDTEAEMWSLEFVDKFYEENDFGAGKEDAGFVYFIDMSNRFPTVYTRGTVMDHVDDYRLQLLLDLVYSDLSVGEFANSAKEALGLARIYMKAGIPEGQFRYDKETGEILPK